MWVEPSGGFEANFVALVRPHSPPLSFYVFLLGGGGSSRVFEAHRSVVMAPPSSCCRASDTGSCS
jgi:hypothetical protein